MDSGRKEEFFLRYWSIKSYVLFSIPSSSLSLSLFFSPLERTFRISKDNPCDRNVSRASNVYRANWTKMMKEGKGDVLLPPSPSSRDAKEQILAWKISVGSVKRCKPVENRWNFSSLSLSPVISTRPNGKSFPSLIFRRSPRNPNRKRFESVSSRSTYFLFLHNYFPR